MEVKGANPFLFAEDEHTSPSSGSSNPFLMDTDSYPENDYSQNVFASTATNPFAFDPMDLGEVENTPNVFSTNETPFSTHSNQISPGDQIIAQATITINSSNQDFFSMSNSDLEASNTFAPPIKPTDLNLKMTNTVDPFDGENSRQPPSKETQDLLMSVMGAMDATSSHLLNKIPPTRSPSPISMRDFHSPSPTPEMFGDLLDVGEASPATRTPEHQKKEDIFEPSTNDSCDINQNPAVVKQPPPKPPPPRPAPPRPAPPAFTPQKPPPPVPAQPMARDFHSSNNDNDICLFGVDGTLPKKAPATKEDILNLYNTSKNEKKVDLLCGSDEALNVDSVDNFPQSSSNSILSFESTPQMGEEPRVESVQEPTAQDNFVSPEMSQGDLQMDTSESHSKGSVSSVTFNPFAASEEILDMVAKGDEISQSNFDFQTTVANTAPTETVSQDGSYMKYVAHSQISKNTNIFGQIPESTIQAAPSEGGFNDTFGVSPNDVSSISSDAFGMSNDVSCISNEAFGVSEDVSALSNDAFAVSNDAFGLSNDTINDKPNEMKSNNFNQTFGGFSNETHTSGVDISVKDDEFDEFAHKFDAVKSDNQTNDAWGAAASGQAFGDASGGFESAGCGFEADEPFDSFLALQEPPCVPQSTPYVLSKQPSADSDEDKDFSVFIK